MTQIITLEEVKMNSRIDGQDEDVLIGIMIAEAEELICRLTNRTIESFIEEFGEFPAPIRSAALMYVDYRYNHRGSDPEDVQRSLKSFGVVIRNYKKLKP